jgi:hypothetical protein
MNLPPNLQRLRGQLLADPSLLAQKLDLFSQRMLFVRFSAEDYRQASFLDDRILTPAMQGVWVSLDDVSAALAGAAPARPLHFIFHAGHVGSTLVSRLLEGAGGVLALREPLPLRALAEAHDALDSPQSLVSPARFADLLRDQIVLWSRGFADTRAVILKATSTAARLAPALLDAAPDARAIYLHLPLEPYLATLLAGENSPIDLRGHAGERMRRLARLGVEPLAPLHAMSIGELAAMSWCAEQLTAAALRKQHGERVLFADFERVLAAPEDALRSFCNHFRLDGSEDFITRTRQDPNWRRYAKAPEHAYTPGDRAQSLAAARAEKAEEIQKGLAWFANASAQRPALEALASFA